MERPPRFHHPGPLDADALSLSGEEARHAGAARRLRAGSKVEIFDGAGTARRGVIVAISRRAAEVRFTSPKTVDPPPLRALTVALSPPRAERMAFAVEKLSELGCAGIVPVIFRRSLDAGRIAGTGRIDRWRRRAVEAAKQCGRNRVLSVAAPLTLQRFVENAEDEGGFLLDPEAADLLRDRFRNADDERRTVVVVGPEGGFTPEEREALHEGGFAPARLWDLVLRIETAAVAAAALFNDAGGHSDNSARMP